MMITRLLGFNSLRLLATRLTKGPSRTYQTNRCDAHMNELPIPCGPWDVWYKGKQSYYNKVLVMGTIWWVISFAMMIYTGSFYLNWGPPAQPGPPSDMVEECEDIE